MRPISWLLAVVACGTPAPSVLAPAPTAGVVAGEPALTGALVPALVETFAKGRAGPPFSVTQSTASEAIRELLAGHVALVASSRDVRPVEEEQAQADAVSLVGPEARHIVGVDVVAVAVHPRNPTESLTYDQVIGVFCTHAIDNWAFLGLADGPIHALAPEPEAGTRVLFEDFFCGPKGIDARVRQASREEIAAALRDDAHAVTFVSLSQNTGKALALKVDPTAPPVRPSQDNIIRGAYPLYGDLYLFTRGAPTGEVAAFLQWVQSPAGQEVVDEQRFVPLFLRPERLDEPRPLRETVHFEMSRAEPNQRSMTRLQLLVQELRERQIRHVVLEGYTDDQEGDAYELSRQRAESVRALLAKEMPELYFEIIPRGPKNPIAPNDTPFGRQVNRRVQIYLAEDEQVAAPAPTNRDG